MVTQTSVFSSAALRTSDRCPLCSAPMVGTRPTVRWFSRSSRLYFRRGAISWKTCVRSLTAKALRRDAVDDKQRMPFWMPLWRTRARRTGAKLLGRPVRAVKTRVHLLGYRRRCGGGNLYQLQCEGGPSGLVQVWVRGQSQSSCSAAFKLGGGSSRSQVIAPSQQRSETGLPGPCHVRV